MERDKRELDDFWNIEDLIPKKAKPIYSAPKRRPSVETVEMEYRGVGAPAKKNTEFRDSSFSSVNTSAGERDTVIKKFIPPFTEQNSVIKDTPSDEYVPENPMITSVKIYKWKNNYNYYEQFCRDAMRLADAKLASAEPEPFFSYVPQYSQLNERQLRWYIYWRGAFRRGEIINTDYSYILLYIYEIINLSDVRDPLTSQRALCRIWCAFREYHPRLDRLLCDWICDLSLIHRLPPPVSELEDIIFDIGESGSFKEFYVPREENSGDVYYRMLMNFCSNYNYRKSKFYRDEYRESFDKHIFGAFREAVKMLSDSGRFFGAEGQTNNKLIRDAYTGAVCSYRIKRKIEIDYTSFSRSHEIRFLVTDIIKYAENRARASLGIKSRLGIYALPSNIRSCIDVYFSINLPRKSLATRAEQKAEEEYEKLYRVEPTPLSLEKARQIEEASWGVTQRLVDAFAEPEGDKDTDEPIVPTSAPNEENEPVVADIPTRYEENSGEPKAMLQESESDLVSALGEKNMEFMRLVALGDAAGQRRFADSEKLMLDSLVERINEIACDVIGDIILEYGGDSLSLVEDYADMLEI